MIENNTYSISNIMGSANIGLQVNSKPGSDYSSGTTKVNGNKSNACSDVLFRSWSPELIPELGIFQVRVCNPV